MMAQKTKVILDTDIGDDIDDTWALGFLLNCPELELLYVLTEYGPTERRAKIACKFLEEVGRGDVEVGIGEETEVQRERMYHESWAAGYDLNAYPGVVSRRGIDRLIEIIMASSEEIVLLCIGPLVNIARAVEREPKIAVKTRIVGMLGSVRSGWFENTPPVAEYNVVSSIKSAQKMFEAWKGEGKITLAPVDSCGRLYLRGALYASWKERAQSGRSKVSLAILQNFEEWAKHRCPKPTPKGEALFKDASSTLFDTVAVYLAFSSTHLKMEQLNLMIKDDGMFVEMAHETKETSPAICAMEWTDMDTFCQFLVDRLLSDTSK